MRNSIWSMVLRVSVCWKVFYKTKASHRKNDVQNTSRNRSWRAQCVRTILIYNENSWRKEFYHLSDTWTLYQQFCLKKNCYVDWIQ